MDLNTRVALLTGARRIGAEVAVELARRGADVAIVSRTTDAEMEQVAGAVRGHGRRALTLEADLRDPAACSRVVDAAAAQLGRLDVLVNMASVYRPRLFDEMSLEDWNAAIEVDLRASWLCARAAVAHMRRIGGGRIVNFSDWVARSGRPRYTGYLAYYVAKGAVIALTEALALELAADQILVNAVAPGPIMAPEGTSPQTYTAVERATPLGRWGGAGEVAKVVVALIESDFVTGETIRVDGGRHVK
jgi:NAD(P)-dependent dehydrogenase (short-subunit alcohol dehydrogenase family)